jgi:hypothetical protein
MTSNQYIGIYIDHALRVFLFEERIIMTHSVFWLTFVNPVNPRVNLATIEKYAPVEMNVTNYRASYKFSYIENPEYDTFEAFEKTGENFVVYSWFDDPDTSLMLKSKYIDGKWGGQEEIEIEVFNEDSGEFEEVESAASNEVKKVLMLFKSKGIKP